MDDMGFLIAGDADYSVPDPYPLWDDVVRIYWASGQEG